MDFIPYPHCSIYPPASNHASLCFYCICFTSWCDINTETLKFLAIYGLLKHNSPLGRFPMDWYCEAKPTYIDKKEDPFKAEPSWVVLLYAPKLTKELHLPSLLQVLYITLLLKLLLLSPLLVSRLPRKPGSSTTPRRLSRLYSARLLLIVILSWSCNMSRLKRRQTDLRWRCLTMDRKLGPRRCCLKTSRSCPPINLPSIISQS